MSELFCSFNARLNVAKQLPEQPANHGCVWTAERLQQLREDYLAGNLLEALCVKHGRTVDSVVAKLSSLNLIRFEPVSGNYYRNPLVQGAGPKNDTPQHKPTTKEETIMANETTPIQNLTLIFGQDIKNCSEANLINVIAKCQDEIRSFSTIPRNKWTDKRTTQLQEAITAAVAELDTRVEE